MWSFVLNIGKYVAKFKDYKPAAVKGHLALLHKAFLMPKEGQEEERYVRSLIKRDARGRPILPREQIWSRAEHVIKSINY